MNILQDEESDNGEPNIEFANKLEKNQSKQKNPVTFTPKLKLKKRNLLLKFRQLKLKKDSRKINSYQENLKKLSKFSIRKS
jgi:hypothetical protein